MRTYVHSYFLRIIFAGTVSEPNQGMRTKCLSCPSSSGERATSACRRPAPRQSTAPATTAPAARAARQRCIRDPFWILARLALSCRESTDRCRLRHRTGYPPLLSAPTKRSEHLRLANFHRRLATGAEVVVFPMEVLSVQVPCFWLHFSRRRVSACFRHAFLTELCPLTVASLVFCHVHQPQQVYENLGMTPYDVLFDSLSAHWVAGKSGGVVVSTPPPYRLCHNCFHVFHDTSGLPRHL